MYGYVIHVDCDMSFIDEVMEYSVHHCLESGQWVGQPKEHDGGFIQSLVSYEHHFPLITVFDENFVVPPFNIESSE